MIALADGWGPERRRAAATLSVEALSGGAGEPMVVSPALPALLDVLGTRDLRATFFATADVAASEPLALTMIANAGNEIGGLADDSLRAIDAIEATGRAVRGVRAVAVDRELLARLARHSTIRYVAGGAGEIGVGEGVVRVGRNASGCRRWRSSRCGGSNAVRRIDACASGSGQGRLSARRANTAPSVRSSSGLRWSRKWRWTSARCVACA